LNTPAFTVVIPAFNERELLPHAVRSVQAQTRKDWEAFVVDDGSSDGTAEAIRPFAQADQRIHLISKPNEGLSAARNTAIERSRAPLISLLDADDMWLPGYLGSMAKALEANPTAGWAYTDAWALDADNGKFRRGTATSSLEQPTVLPENPVEMMKLLIRQNFIWVSATIRRSALNDAGLFDPELKSAEDIDLWLRILARGYSVVRTKEILGIKREREEAMSREGLKNVTNLQEVMTRVAGDETIPAEVRTIAAERINSLERWRLALSGESRMLALGLALRLKLGTVKRALLRRHEWLSEPPAEVQAAFPELVSR